MSDQNPLSGLQLIALHGLLTTGEGLAPATFGTSTAAFEAIPTVAGFKDMLAAATTASITADELRTLQTIGADTVPALFGSVPSVTAAVDAVSAGLQPGFALDQISARATDLFPVDGGPAVFVQTFTQASGYASMSYDVLKSAATATFGSFENPGKLITGGLSNIVGDSKPSLEALGTGLKQTGNLINVDKIESAFSAAGALKTVIDNGSDQVGNLQSKVLGQVLTSSTGSPILDSAGNPIVITRDFITSLVNSPETIPNADADGPLPSTVLSTSVNNLDKALADFVNKKLTSPTEIAAIASLNDLSGTAEAVTSFNDLLNPVKQLGPAAQFLSSTNPSDIVKTISTSIGGIDNLSSTKSLAQACENIIPLDSSFNLIKDLTIPLSYNEFAELVTAMGGGTGPYGNAQLSDFMGQDPSAGIAAVTGTVQQLASTAESINIASDLALLKDVLAGGTFPITFSNGSIANTLSEAVTFGSAAINTNAAAVKTFADVNNLSANLTQYVTAISSSNIGELLYSKAKIDVSSMEADVGSLVGFVSGLHGIANDTTLGSLDVIKRFADPSTKAGQAILASLIEGQNLSTLSKAGLKIDNFTSVPTYSGAGIGIIPPGQTAPPPGPGTPGVPPPPFGAPVPRPNATTPRILSVKAYRPGNLPYAGPEHPVFEVRYEGIINWQDVGVMIVDLDNPQGQTIWCTTTDDRYWPPLTGEYGVQVLPADIGSVIPTGTKLYCALIGNRPGVNFGVWVVPQIGLPPYTLQTDNTTPWP